MALYHDGFYALSRDLRFSDCNGCSLSLILFLSLSLCFHPSGLLCFMFTFSCEIYEQKVKFSYLVYADITKRIKNEKWVSVERRCTLSPPLPTHLFFLPKPLSPLSSFPSLYTFNFSYCALKSATCESVNTVADRILWQCLIWLPATPTTHIQGGRRESIAVGVGA